MAASTLPASPAPQHNASWTNNAKILWHLAFARVHGSTHAERLESFYSGQAEGYDSFRAHLLHGRQQMISAVDFPEGGVWVDFGAGTGENIELLGDAISALGSVHLVDLAPSLLNVADERIHRGGWSHVSTHEADATDFSLGANSADVVTFSYSLTMIPNWFLAIQRAIDMLKPGGTIGVVDYYVARKYPAEHHRRQSWLRRVFWQQWFACDNVFLNPDHVPFLHSHFDVTRFEERAGKVPFLPFVRAPYYVFIGRKLGDNGTLRDLSLDACDGG